MLRLILLTALACVLASCASTPSAPPKPAIEKDNFTYLRSYLQWMISQEMKREKLVGVSVVVVAGGETIMLEGFGNADRQHRQKVSPNTRFRAGSLAKPLNALKVLALMEQGKLDLDRVIAHYLPNFSSADITLRQLLSHQAGLPSDLIRGMWVSEPKNFKHTFAYLENTQNPHPPNTLLSYSNLGFNVVGAIIEAASQGEYETVMNSFIADDLGMINSQFSASPQSPATAQAYDYLKPLSELSLRDVPAAGLSTSAQDLANLLAWLQADNSLTEHQWQTLVRDQSSHLPLNFGRRAGLGVFMYDGIFHPSITVLGHGGASVNHRAVIKFSADRDYGVALLSNSKNASLSLHRMPTKR